MIRSAWLLGWLRWRTLVNALRRRRRQGLDRFSAHAGVLAVVVLALLLAPIAAGFAAGGWAAGRTVGTPAFETALLGARLIGLVLAVVLVLAPFLRSSSDAGSGATRLRLLPLAPGTLHASSVLAGLADPWVAAVLPAFVAFPLGLASVGRGDAALAAAVAGLALLALLLALGALAASTVQLLMRSRRRGEAAVLVVVLLLSFVGVIPLVLMPDERSERAQAPRAVERVGRIQLPAWIEALPPSQFALAVDASSRGRDARAALHAAGVAGVAGVLWLASSRLHRRLLEEPASGSRRGARRAARATRGAAWTTSPAGAVALATASTVLRTVRGKLAVASPPLMVAVFGLVRQRLADSGEMPFPSLVGAAPLFYMGVATCFLNLSAIALNQYAADRAGLTLQFLLPLDDEDIVRGKSHAWAALTALAIVPSAAVAALLASPSHVADWIAALLGLASVHAIVAPVAAVLSATFPKSVDIAKTTGAAQPHAAAGLLGAVAVIVAIAIPPIARASVGALAGSPWAGAAAVAAWLAAAVLASRLALPLAIQVLASRRESVALVAQGR